MGLRSAGFSVVGTDGGAAFQELMPNYIRSFAARQFADKLDYRKGKPLRPRFKLLFQFDPSSIRNSRSAIRNSNKIREGLLRLAEIPDAQEDQQGNNCH